MRIVAIREQTVPLSRYEDPTIPWGGLDTSVVAVQIDAPSGPKVGYGFGSIGRFAQRGLIADRFAPRLLSAKPETLLGEDGEIDPVCAWNVMMAGEKAGGHGERCVAVGAVEMALWDLAAKRVQRPLCDVLAQRFGRTPVPAVEVYASGGYPYPTDDLRRLGAELARMCDAGYKRIKIKLGARDLVTDLRRIEATLEHVSADRLAVDAMNTYDNARALAAADAFAPYGLWWFEDVCDPHDFATQRALTARYPGAIAAGEPLFSTQEAILLADYGGLRSDRDILLFDPAHCYGVTGFVRIVDALTQRGWPRQAFWPHGGHLFSLHLAAAFGLGGTEVNPFSFPPFGGLADTSRIVDGRVTVPAAPGIGFETRASLRELLAGFNLD